eukprot:GSChrysophyteH1.ASY1.ANO1.3304.1 assembled CDS
MSVLPRSTLLVLVALIVLSYTCATRSRKLRRRLESESSDFDLDLAEFRAQKVVNLIFQRFEMWHPTRRLFFWYIMNIPNWGWDILKYKLALKTLLPHDAQSEFLFIFGGSSVTAGHDNRFNESYPIVFRRRISGMFQALNVPVTVRNIAQGANNCFPSTFCYGSMGGHAPDWVNWEQSFNCGKAHNVFEHIAREASWNDAVLHFQASGAFRPEECLDMPLDKRDNGGAGLRKKVAWTREEWTPELEGLEAGELIPHDYPEEEGYLAHVYTPYFPNATKANPVGRFTGQIWPHYNGVAPHGFSVWTSGSEGDAMSLKGPCYDKGGPHWMVRETAEYSRGHGASWHPSAGMHLLRGELLAYNYLHIFLDAVQMLRADLRAQKAEGKEDRVALIDKYKAELKKLQTKMPKKPLHCSPDCDVQPRCYTNFKPHYNPKELLSEIIVGKPNGWNYIMKSGSTSHLMDNIDWGYLDRRPCYETQGVPDSTISFKVEIKSKDANYVKVCAYEHKEGLRPAKFYLDAYVDPPCSQCTEAKPVGEEWATGTAGAIGGELPNMDLEPVPAPNDDGYHPGGQRQRQRQRRLGDKEEKAGNDYSKIYSSSATNSNVNTTQYVLPPIEELMPLTARSYHGDECHQIVDLPVGKHVLTIKTHHQNEHETHHAHIYSLSHVLQWG